MIEAESDCSVNVIDSKFLGNKAIRGSGGAFYGTRGVSAYMRNVTIVENDNRNVGGAVAIYTNTTLELYESYIDSNIAYDHGGAVYVGANGTLKAIASTFTSNKGFQGAAIAVLNGETYLANSVFRKNYASNGGGAIHILESDVRVSNQ